MELVGGVRMDFGGNRGLDSRPGAEALDRRLHIQNVFKDILTFKVYIRNIFASIFNFEVQPQISLQILKFLFKMRFELETWIIMTSFVVPHKFSEDINSQASQ